MKAFLLSKDNKFFLLLRRLLEVCEQAIIGLEDFITSVRVEACSQLINGLANILN